MRRIQQSFRYFRDNLDPLQVEAHAWSGTAFSMALVFFMTSFFSMELAWRALVLFVLIAIVASIHCFVSAEVTLRKNGK